MRFQMYANNRRTQRKEKSQVKGYTPITENIKKGSFDDDILNIRVNNLMELYRGNTEVIDDLKNKISDLLLNITIARDINSKVQEKTLKKEFSGYLTKLEKEIKNNG